MLGLALGAGALLYAWGVARLWRRAGVGHGVRGAQVFCFTAGIATLVVALLPPLDALAEALFSAHMAQHLLLIVVAAPLIAAGEPVLPLLWALPPAWRPRVARVAHRLRALGAPVIVFLAHMVAMWVWHLPGPYQAALDHESVHVVEHVSFFGTAVLMWWFVLQPIGRRRWSYPTAAICLTATMMHSGALGALLQFARTPWYPAHAAGAGAWGLTALEDQQLAGLIMFVPAGIVYIGFSLAVLYRWLDSDAERSYLERLCAESSPSLAS